MYNYSRVTQHPEPAIPHDNDRSWRYTYDDLNRLVDAHLGQLDTNNETVSNPVPGIMHSMSWELDALGNWAAGSNNDSVFETGDWDGSGTIDGNDAPRTLHHVVKGNNELDTVSVNGVAQTYAHDDAGNIAKDGTYEYFYDGLNRLIEVRPVNWTTGEYVAKFVYDGFGRLIRVERRVGTGTDVYVDLYYDGVRRILEVGDSDGPTYPGWDTPNVLREYVYGPSDTDEFILHGVGAAGTATYILQDANYDVMALVDASGVVVEQYSYTPYGKTLTVERLATNPDNRLGFQGMFFERLDADVYTGSADAITPGARGLYYARNRWYSADLGRFTQRDPNATELPILSAAAMNGEALHVMAGGFDPSSLYGDGLNLYQFVNSNPVTRRDPLGLYDEFDDAISDFQGYKVGVLGFIQEASGFLLIGTKHAVSIAGGLLGITDLYNAGKRILNGEGNFWDWLEVGTTLAGPAVGIAFKAFKWAKKIYNAGKARKAFKAATAAGRAYEKLVLTTLGLVKNTNKISHNGVNAIPDAITAAKVIEIKDVKRISLSPQLKSIAGWAKENGKEAVLIVSDKNEYISGPVRRLFTIQSF